MRRSRGATLAWGAALASALAAGGARADGAFPEAQQLLLPPGEGTIYVGTNFGLLRSDGAGASWGLVCDAAIGRRAALYQLGPTGTLYAATLGGLARSTDRGCGWHLSRGALAGQRVVDAFPDPVDPERVYAIAERVVGGVLQSPSLHRSSDGGATFGEPLYQAAPGHVLGGVEAARGRPGRLYATEYDPPGHRAFILRSDDGGDHFTRSDVTSGAGPRTLGLAAIDPTDGSRIYLRAVGVDDDALLVSDDAGASVRELLGVSGRMSAFVRTPGGALYVGAFGGSLHRSLDGGATFARVLGPGHVRALAARGSALYAATDEQRDGFGAALSVDEGASWRPILRLAEVAGPLACADAGGRCDASWAAVRAQLPSSRGDGGDASSGGTRPAIRGGGCRSDGRRARFDDATLALLGATVALLLVRRTLRRA